MEFFNLNSLVFVATLGFLASRHDRGGWIPLTFVIASTLGMLLHLLGGNIVRPDIAIVLAVILLGGMLASIRFASLRLFIELSAIAGLFQGYAFGSWVTRANAQSLLLKTIGFGGLQIAIALIALLVGRFISDHHPHQLSAWIQWMGVGIVVAAIGATLFRVITAFT